MCRWTLNELLGQWAGDADLPETDITGLCLDSRRMQPGGLFIALGGAQFHGLRFAADAVARGASAIAFDPQQVAVPADHGIDQVPVIAAPGLAKRLGELGSMYYGAPSEDMLLVGVTGTNGKTSTAHFVAQAWHNHHGNAGFIGTIGAGPVHSLIESERTTPDALSLQAMLAGLRRQSQELVAMEVSSHALEQGRCDMAKFDVGIFTNLSRDHLDYHGDMASYMAAKKRLFEEFLPTFAVINADDPVGREWIGEFASSMQVLSYSLENPSADLYGQVVSTDIGGLHFHLHSPWGRSEIRSPLLGAFNVQNLLSCAGALGALGVPFPRLSAQLELMQPVPGRMVRLGGEEESPLVVVDYAHTPDALEQVLKALRGHTQGRLICVFGCGGDRDRGKRPEMGAIAEAMADYVVVTSDNPRSENSVDIITDVVGGMTGEAFHVEADRGNAIRWAIAGATDRDVVLIAGKGHENYQEIDGNIMPFNDELEARLALGVAA